MRTDTCAVCRHRLVWIEDGWVHVAYDGPIFERDTKAFRLDADHEPEVEA